MVFMLICMCFYFTGAPPPAEANFQACTGFIFFPELSLGLGHLRGHALCGAPLPILLPPPPLLPGLGQGLIVQVLLDPGPHTIRSFPHLACFCQSLFVTLCDLSLPCECPISCAFS